MKRGAPDYTTFDMVAQLCQALAAKLAESVRERLFYTQEVRGSSPLPPTIDIN
ncbi:MAG: hypothetical protein ACETVW_01340 [Dehalococcoidia bacterium]